MREPQQLGGWGVMEKKLFLSLFDQALMALMNVSLPKRQRDKQTVTWVGLGPY